MGAGAAVGAAAGQRRRQQTAPRIGHAHGPVNKGLQFQVTTGANRLYLLKGQFAPQIDPADTVFLPENSGGGVGGVGLSG